MCTLNCPSQLPLTQLPFGDVRCLLCTWPDLILECYFVLSKECGEEAGRLALWNSPVVFSGLIKAMWFEYFFKTGLVLLLEKCREVAGHVLPAGRQMWERNVCVKKHCSLNSLVCETFILEGVWQQDKWGQIPRRQLQFWPFPFPRLSGRQVNIYGVKATLNFSIETSTLLQWYNQALTLLGGN
jgi:hypothetical protein